MAEFTNIKINDVKYDVRDANAARASALATKQDVLVSGTNIKTINGQSLVGSGNITVVGEKGDKGDTGSVTVTDGVAQITIVNDLTTGGTGDALSAEMGKYLGQTALVGMGTFAQAYVKSQSNHDLWCWMLNDMVDGEVIRKPIWHVGSGTFVDAVGSVVSIAIAPPAEPVFSLDDSEDVLSGSTLNVTFFGTLHYIIDGGTEQTTSTSPLALTLNADTDIEAWVEDSIGLLSQHVTKSYTIAVDHRLQFKIALTGDNSTEYVPITNIGGPLYNMTVDWGDGTTTDYSNNGADKTGVKKDCGHAYVGNAGDEFIITIRGTRCDKLFWGDNTCSNSAALVAILDNTLEFGTEHGAAANVGFGANLESISANALSNNTYGHVQFSGTKLTSLPDGLLSHLTKNSNGLFSCQNMFSNMPATFSLSASQMEELASSIGGVTNFGSMFYGFKGTASIPDTFFDGLTDASVTNVWGMTHTAGSSLTGDALALYNVLKDKVTSSAQTAHCLSGNGFSNKADVPSTWK